MTLAFPLNALLRVKVVASITGDSDSVLQEAILAGELQAVKRGRLLYTSLEWHRKWLENEGEWRDPEREDRQGLAL